MEIRKKLPNPYRKADALKKANKPATDCIQREELRLSNSYTGDPRIARSYALRFRMPKTVLNQPPYSLDQDAMENGAPFEVRR